MGLEVDFGKRSHDATLADGDVVRQIRLAPTRTRLTAPTEWLGELASIVEGVRSDPHARACAGREPS